MVYLTVVSDEEDGSFLVEYHQIEGNIIRRLCLKDENLRLRAYYLSVDRRGYVLELEREIASLATISAEDDWYRARQSLVFEEDKTDANIRPIAERFYRLRCEKNNSLRQSCAHWRDMSERDDWHKARYEELDAIITRMYKRYPFR